MIKLKYADGSFTFLIGNGYTIAANSVEEAKRELFDRIEMEIDRFVLSKLNDAIVNDDFDN